MDPAWRDLVYPRGERSIIARESAAAKRLAEAEVLFTGWGAPRFDATFFARAPRLRAIFHAGGSVQYCATDEVWRRGVILCSAASANAMAVRDYTLAAILFSLRDGWHHLRAAHERGAFAARRPVAGAAAATVGLIGLGAVGQLVASEVARFVGRLLVCDPFASPRRLGALGAEPAELGPLFAASDVVSVHAPSLPATAGMIGRAHFARMKRGATFINTARGSLVREAELIAVFRRRADLTAVLDVTDPEPPAPGSPLFTLPNVFLTPHLAGTVASECQRLGRCMVEEFLRWKTGGRLRHRVARAQLRIRA